MDRCMLCVYESIIAKLVLDTPISLSDLDPLNEQERALADQIANKVWRSGAVVVADIENQEET